MGRDLRQAARVLLHQPGFSVLAALVLGLGIGATCTVFSAVHAVLLAGSPIHAPERLAMVWENNLSRDQQEVEFSYPNFQDLRAQSQVFDGFATFPSVAYGLTLLDSGAPEKLQGTYVSEDFFPLLRVSPSLGRGFSAADFKPGAPATVLVSHALWRDRFGSDPQLIGRTLKLEGQLTTVVGVLPAGFDFPRGAQLYGAFVPEPGDWTSERGFRVLATMGRLKPGVTLEQARAELTVLAERLATAYPKENGGYGVNVVSFDQYVLGSARPALWVLLGAVALVLLMACVNVANLFLARATSRERELAVRRALGASRAQVFRQLLAETWVVAGLGGVAGVLFAAWGVDTLRALAPADIPRLEEVGLNGAVIACAVGTTMATALACGLLPALRLSNAPALEALKSPGGRSSSGRRTQRLRSALVVLQVSLALVLVCGAGLLVRSFTSLRRLEPGYDARDLFTARIELNQSKYDQSAKRAAVYEQILERVRALPGVQSAGLVLMRPLSGTIGWDYPFIVEGQTPAEQAANPYSNYLAISPEYFKTMRTPLLHGRDFTPADRADAPGVLIVGESMAKRFWPQGDAVGKRVKLGKLDSAKPWLTVVGVVKDARYREWSALRPDLYVPYLQQSEFRTDLVVRTSLPPLVLAPDIREVVQEVDPSQPLSEVTTMQAAVDAALARPRFNAWLASVLALLALCLAVVGVYGVIGYAVSLRQWEIGVRLALGAQRGQVLWMVLRQGAWLAACGVVLGLPVYLGVARLMQGLLFGVAPTDPLTVGGVVLALVVTATFAAAVPAVRAARLSPSLALREDG